MDAEHKNVEGATGGFDGLDARIDGSLRRMYKRSPDLSIDGAVAARVASAPARRREYRVAAALAALLFALVGAALWAEHARQTAGPTGDSAQPDEVVASWIAVFDESSAGGAQVVCECGPECCTLEDHCLVAFGLGLTLDTRAGFIACGDCCSEGAGTCVSLTARAGGELVCMFVVPADQAPERLETGREDLRLHRRQLGAVVAFEVSQRGESKLIQHLQLQ